MTEGLKLPLALTASPEEVAAAIYAANMKKTDVIYVRPIWLPVMTIIKSLPEALFKKTRL